MVGTVCIVPNCSTATPSKVSRFRFPRDVKRCLRWIVACNSLSLFQRFGGSAERLYKSRYRVCALHFEDSMYCGPKKKNLHLDAVPSINLGNAASSLELDVFNQPRIMPLPLQHYSTTVQTSADKELHPEVKKLDQLPNLDQQERRIIPKGWASVIGVIRVLEESSCSSIETDEELSQPVEVEQLDEQFGIEQEQSTTNDDVEIVSNTVEIPSTEQVLQSEEVPVVQCPTFRIFPKPINQLLPTSVAVQTSPLLCSTLPQVKHLKRKLRNATNAKNSLYQKLLASKDSIEQQCTLKQFLTLCDKFLPPCVVKLAKSEAKLYHKQKRKNERQILKTSK